MLELERVNAEIDGSHILGDVSLSVWEGELVTLLGANGAGKSSLMRVIAGLIKPTRGSITFRGESIAGVRPEKIVRKGISLCPENRHLFPRLSVRINLMLGAYAKRYDQDGMDERLGFVHDLFPILKQRDKQLAGTLSGGEQQMLAIARGLMSDPLMLLMDEPSLGLAPLVVEAISEKIVEINKSGTTILLSEQNANLALSISSRAYVLENGEVVMEGDSRDLSTDARVRKAYIGL